jgi:hypothetical protein
MFTYKTPYLNRRILAVSVLFAALFVASTTVQAQHADSKVNNSPTETSQQNRQGTLAQQAARGEIPMSFADERLQPDTQKIRRLPPTSLPEQATKPQGKQQIGVTRKLESPLRLSADSVRYDVVGGQVFLLNVISEGAKSIRVRFSQMNLPEGARVFVYPLGNKDEFYGPFQKNSPLEDGTFWTPPVQGEAVVIESFIPNTSEQKNGDYFQVSEVAHIFIGKAESFLFPRITKLN